MSPAPARRLSPIARDDRAIGFLERQLFEVIDLPPDQILEYLKTRGPFLSRVIQADLKYPIGKGLSLTVEKIAADALYAAPAATAPKEIPKASVEDEVLAQVEKITGFSKESLNRNMRLLDDLNLDSIKAGDLMVKIAKVLDIPAPEKTLDYSNASLSNVIDLFDKAVAQEGGRDVEDKMPDAFETIMNQASDLTGYPSETLDADALVEIDLGIGPDKLRNLIEGSTKLLGIDSHLDLEPLRERSLRQIASILDRLAKEQVRSETYDAKEPLAASGIKGLFSWVRDFKVELVEAPSPPLPDWWGKRKEDDWQEVSALIVHEGECGDIADALRNLMLAKGARVRTALFDEARESNLSDDPSYSHLLAVLPGLPGPWDSPEDIREADGRAAGGRQFPAPRLQGPSATHHRRLHPVRRRRFRNIGALPSPQPVLRRRHGQKLAPGTRRPPREGPGFYQGPRSRYTCGNRSVRNQHPGAIRSRRLRFRTESEGSQDDGRLPRRLHPRDIAWSCNDVLVVTGGARGITASIAFELARRIGARMALLGSSKHPGKNAQGDIAKNLKKYSDSRLGRRVLFLRRLRRPGRAGHHSQNRNLAGTGHRRHPRGRTSTRFDWRTGSRFPKPSTRSRQRSPAR